MTNLVFDKNKCCGCSHCMHICPVGAITMVEDNEGFKYPNIDNEKCIHCNKCKNLCQFNKNKDYSQQFDTPLVYAVKHKDGDVVANSRSGGIFTALSDYVLNLKGAVYGCVLTDDMQVVHIRATNQDDRNKMRGSKYVEGNILAIYEQVKNDVASGKHVLISGTSCQVDALRNYLKSLDCSKVIFMDILCQQVTSYKIWKDYIAYLEKKHKGVVTNFNFRDKQRFGWDGAHESFDINSYKYYSNAYASIYYSCWFSRPACYTCPYKTINHPADITIGDFWGIEKAAPEFNDNKGVSLVLVNNDKGKLVFDKISSTINFEQTTIDKAMQPVLIKSIDAPTTRDKSWRIYNKKGIKAIVKSIKLKQFKTKCLRKIKKILRINK